MFHKKDKDKVDAEAKKEKKDKDEKNGKKSKEDQPILKQVVSTNTLAPSKSPDLQSPPKAASTTPEAPKAVATPPTAAPPTAPRSEGNASTPPSTMVASGSGSGTFPSSNSPSYKPNVSANEYNTATLRAKLDSLPKDTRLLVDSLLGLLGKASLARQQQIQAQASKEAAPEPPAIGEQIDVMVEKLVETSELLFNKDHHSMLKRLSKELVDSPETRADKWRRWARLFEQDRSFAKAFLSSPAFEASVKSAVAKPLPQDEADVLLEVFSNTVISEIDRKELLEVVKAFSNSNQHIPGNQGVDGASNAKTLAECVVSLIASFKINPDGLPQVAPPREPESTAASKGSVSLLHHVATINHMKLGTEQSRPLFLFFKREIASSEKQGKDLADLEGRTRKEKQETKDKLGAEIKAEEEKLKQVNQEIVDLRAHLKAKKEEARVLEEQKTAKEKELEQYDQDQGKKVQTITTDVQNSTVQLENHQKTSEWLARFVAKVSQGLDSEINECMNKTKDILLEQEKEMAFLEEKMASYERSISLFSKDEPELMGGLRKLFDRCQSVYSDSKETTARVQAVLTLLKKVQTGKDQKPLDDLQVGVDRIIGRQQALGKTYKLQ